jgi:hypothetical protein
MEFKRPYNNFRAAKKTNPNSNEIKWPEPRYVRVKISDRIRVRKLFVFCRKKYKWDNKIYVPIHRIVLGKKLCNKKNIK